MTTPTQADRARFDAKWVQGPGECRTWIAAKNQDGYGRFGWRGRNHHAHRVALMWSGVELPKGRHTDHLCRNRACVNPAHMEVVTPRENILRGVGPSAQNAVRTHCPRGHEFTPENIQRHDSKGGRLCRTCKRDRERRYYREQKAG